MGNTARGGGRQVDRQASLRESGKGVRLNPDILHRRPSAQPATVCGFFCRLANPF